MVPRLGTARVSTLPLQRAIGALLALPTPPRSLVSLGTTRLAARASVNRAVPGCTVAHSRCHQRAAPTAAPSGLTALVVQRRAHPAHPAPTATAMGQARLSAADCVCLGTRVRLVRAMAPPSRAVPGSTAMLAPVCVRRVRRADLVSGLLCQLAVLSNISRAPVLLVGTKVAHP